MHDNNQARRWTAALMWIAAVYLSAAAVFLFMYLWRFREASISDAPADWAGFAQMIGALIGVPIAFGSIAFVLRTVQLQQDQIDIQQRQHSELLARENAMLDPQIQQVSRPETSLWTEEGDERVFRLKVLGTAQWMYSTLVGRSSPAIITTPSGEIDVIMWPIAEQDGRYRAFLNYQRANGSTAWYWVVAIPPDEGSEGYSFAVKSASGPTEAEDGIEIQVLDP